MMKRRYGVKIEKPCPMKWEELPGDEKRRYCESCQLHVHNLTAMGRSERRAFLAQSGGEKCVAFTVPTPRRWPVFKMSRVGMMLASLVAVLLPGCANRTVTMGAPLPDEPADCKQVKETEDKTVIVGGIPFYDRPLWQRILWPFN